MDPMGNDVQKKVGERAGKNPKIPVIYFIFSKVMSTAIE